MWNLQVRHDKLRPFLVIESKKPLPVMGRHSNSRAMVADDGAVATLQCQPLALSLRPICLCFRAETTHSFILVESLHILVVSWRA